MLALVVSKVVVKYEGFKEHDYGVTYDKSNNKI